MLLIIWCRKLTSCCKNGHSAITPPEVAKDNASHVLAVSFWSSPSCYKGLSDNKLANCYGNNLISLLFAFTVGDTGEQQSTDQRSWFWGSCLVSLGSPCLVIHQTKDFQESCANPLSYRFWAGSSSCLLPLCPEEAMAFASNSLCV